MTVLLISESALKEGIKGIYDSFSRYHEFRLAPWVYATRESVKDIFSVPGFFQTVSTQYRNGEKLRLRDNYEVIEELRERHGITRLLAIAGLSRANYYKWRNARSRRAEIHARDHEIKEHMISTHLTHPYFGYPRMQTASVVYPNRLKRQFIRLLRSKN